VHVLIGTDGSGLAVTAARRGVTLLSRPDRVTVLTVITRVPTDGAEDWEESFAWPDEEDRRWNVEVAQANGALDRTAAALAGAPVETRLEIGDVARTICEVAGELGVDAIVVGSKTRHRLGRLVRGSVSEYLVHHAPCPVLVLRASQLSLDPSVS
jgi:nucleotide-binding universal stress UspA family protein